jgi:PST family polysaccharide transporter
MDTRATPVRNLTGTALSALRWNYAGFLSRSVAGFVVGIVLARLLGPKPFGQLGVAAIAFGLGNQLADAGFSSALVQAPDLPERHIRFAFTMQVLIGCTMTAVAWLIAPVLGKAFRDPGVVGVVRAVSPLFFLQSLGQTATGLLKRKMRFRPIQAAQIVSYLAGYAIVGVTMAYLGYGVWSLVAAQLTQPLLYSVIAYANVRHSLRFQIDLSGLRLARFGAQVTGANLINWTISNLDNIFVGRVFGSTSLGLYSRSFNLASNPVEGFVTTVQQVLFASCSRVEQRREPMRRAYLAAIGGVALVTMPVFWSLAVCGQLVIGSLYGSRWGEAAPLFTAFAAAMPFFALMAIAGPVLGAADLVHQEISTQGASLVFSLIVFAAAAQFSLIAVAWAVPLVYAFRFWCATRPTLHLLGLRWRDVGTVVAGPALGAAFTAACVFGASRAGGNTRAPGILLLELAVIGFVSLTSIAYLGGRRIIPVALAGPLIARATNLPSGISRLLAPFAVRRESGPPPAV